eukprot:886961-Prorocentrum_lima.AAC.1
MGLRGLHDWDSREVFPLQEGNELTLCMRLRGGDPEGDSERFELRLAQGLLRMSQLRKTQGQHRPGLNDTEYEASNVEWNDVK